MAARAIPVLAILVSAMALPAAEPAGKPAPAGQPAAASPADVHQKTRQELQRRLDELSKARGGTTGKEGAAGGKGTQADLQAQIDQMLRDHPELGEARRAGGGPAAPGTSTTSRSSHCTATVNGKKVYDGPGSSVSVETKSDGTTTTEKVVVDGKTVKDR